MCVDSKTVVKMESSGSIKIEKLQDASQWIRWRFQVKITLSASEVFDVVSGGRTKTGRDR